MDLTERLARARKARGLSQAEAAERLNVSRQAISRWETGTGMPTLDNLIQMGKLYQVSLDELVYGAGGLEAQEPEIPPEAPETAQAPKRRRPALLVALALVAVGVLALRIGGSGLMNGNKSKQSSSVIVVGGVEQDWDRLPLDRAGEQVGLFAEVAPVEQELGIHVLEDTQYRSGSDFERDINTARAAILNGISPLWVPMAATSASPSPTTAPSLCCSRPVACKKTGGICWKLRFPPEPPSPAPLRRWRAEGITSPALAWISPPAARVGRWRSRFPRCSSRDKGLAAPGATERCPLCNRYVVYKKRSIG